MSKLQRSALVGVGVVALLGAVGCGGSEIQYGTGYATTPVYTTGYVNQPVYYSNGYYAPGYRRGYYGGRAYVAPPRYRGRVYAPQPRYRGQGRVVVQPTAPRYSGPVRGAPRGGRVVVRQSGPARGGYARGGGGGYRGGGVRGGVVVRRR